MTGLENDTEFVHSLCEWANMAPSAVAAAAGLAATTITRPHNGKAKSRISQPTLDKLKDKFPDFPGWQNEIPNLSHRIGKEHKIKDFKSDLIFVPIVNCLSLIDCMKEKGDRSDFDVMPFRLEHIRGVTRDSVEKLVIVTECSDCMEPTLLRGDLLMIDTSQRAPSTSEQIWAFAYAGGGMVKRLRHMRASGVDQFMIVSDNPRVPDFCANPDDLRIIGKLVWVGRSI